MATIVEHINAREAAPSSLLAGNVVQKNCSPVRAENKVRKSEMETYMVIRGCMSAMV